MKKYRIGILGAGAVGGFVAGRLANTFNNSEEAEIILIARGQNKTVIKERGIKIITPSGEENSFPDIVSNEPSEIGKLDVLVVATKSYDLEEAIAGIRNNISFETVILPLINGVSASSILRQLIPDAEVLEGFMYIVACLSEPGVVKVSGKGHSLYLGSSSGKNKRVEYISTLFLKAGINAKVPDDIIKAAWEKFFFISTMATITSYLNKSIHEIADVSENRELWNQLLNELLLLAAAKQIPFDDNIIQLTLSKGDALPADATTSMSRDFRNNKRTEIELLTGYVIREAAAYKLELPLYEKMYQALLTVKDNYNSERLSDS